MSIERLTATRANAEPAADLSFAIAVTESAARPRHTMKHGDSFLVMDSHGDIGVSAGGPDGLFHHDTRYLSHFGLLVNGLQPLLLGSNLSNDNCVLTVDLTNPDIVDRDRIILSKSLLHVSRTVFVARDTLYQRFVVHNYAAESVPLLLSFTFGSDFADVFEVRGLARPRRGVAHAEMGESWVLLSYAGLDGVTRRLDLRFTPAPTALTISSAAYRIELAPQSSASFYATSCCDPQSAETTPFLRVMRRTHLEMKQLIRVSTEIRTSNHRFNEMLRRSTVDLAMLLTETPQGLLSLCRNSLVFDNVRPRRLDHGAAMLVARSPHSSCRVATFGGDAGGQVRCGIGRRARQDPARDARGRDGQAQRSPVRPLLRQRRFRLRCSSCSRANMRRRAAIWRRCRSSGRR